MSAVISARSAGGIGAPEDAPFSHAASKNGRQAAMGSERAARGMRHVPAIVPLRESASRYAAALRASSCLLAFRERLPRVLCRAHRRTRPGAHDGCAEQQRILDEQLREARLGRSAVLEPALLHAR